MRLSRLAILAAAAALALLADAGDAAAYPQFQFSTGAARCGDCHFSPAGGGLINDYGRSEAGDTISRSGDGSFLHGAWTPPEALQLGADYRGAVIARTEGDQTKLLGFPMQADLYVRAAVGGFSLNVIAGMRGAARAPRPAFVDRLISREHYVMYQKDQASTYVRAGRFFPIYGLRLVDHTAYVRRFMGFYTFEESYAVEAGTYAGDWALDASLDTPVPTVLRGAGAQAFGATFHAERSLRDETASLAIQGRVAASEDDARYTLGTVGKMWLESKRLLLMGQLDLQLQTIDAGAEDVGRGQLAGYLGATWFWKPWFLLGGAAERWDPDLAVRDDERDALDLSVNVFPYAHVEVQLLGKLEAQGNDWGDADALGMLMLHYYL